MSNLLPERGYLYKDGPFPLLEKLIPGKNIYTDTYRCTSIYNFIVKATHFSLRSKYKKQI